jgi:type II secretory pathway component PulF
MNFQYVAKSTAGETVTGLLAAASVGEAQHRLRQKELFVVSIRPAAGNFSAAGRTRQRSFGSKISKRDLVTLTSQLAIMTRAGVDLASSLGNICSQCANPALRTILHRVHEEVLSGKPVSRALGVYEHVFGEDYVASVAAAEASGRLPEVLDRLAGLLRSQLRTQSTMRTLLAYPLLLIGISTLVIIALVFFVLPQFAGVFKQLDVPLPAITSLLIGVSTELRVRFWLWGSLFLAVLGGLWAFAASPAGRRHIDRLTLNLFPLREITRSLWIGRALRLLGTMIDSGVPLVEGLQMTRAAVRNSLLKDLFTDLEEEVLNGRGLSNTFLSNPLVPPAAAQMVATAERTGTLAMVTQLMGEYFEEDGESRLRELATILEPLIIIMMGIVVAFVVMAVMLPVFDFATATR